MFQSFSLLGAIVFIDIQENGQMVDTHHLIDLLELDNLIDIRVFCGLDQLQSIVLVLCIEVILDLFDGGSVEEIPCLKLHLSPFDGDLIWAKVEVLTVVVVQEIEERF